MLWRSEMYFILTSSTLICHYEQFMEFKMFNVSQYFPARGSDVSDGVTLLQLVVLKSPGQDVVECDVHPGTGELQPVPHGQVLAVVGEVGVPGGLDHPGHRVETHPEDGGVRAAARPDEDRARSSPACLDD